MSTAPASTARARSQGSKSARSTMPTKPSPTRICPLACSTAIRAEQPVPVGERSILPGRIATAAALVAWAWIAWELASTSA